LAEIELSVRTGWQTSYFDYKLHNASILNGYETLGGATATPKLSDLSKARTVFPPIKAATKESTRNPSLESPKGVGIVMDAEIARNYSWMLQSSPSS
jgi:hypothetical protein